MAIEWLQRAGLALADATQDAWFFPRWASTHYNRGVVYLAIGDFDKAIADFSEAIRINPRLFMAYQNRGVAHQVRGEHGLALADAQRALSLCREHPGFHGYLPDLHVNRAISYKFLGEFDRAMDEAELALRVNPRFAAAYGERGVIHQQEGRHERGMDDFTFALELQPRNALFLRSRGCGYFYTGDFARAAVDLDRSFSREAEPYAALMLHLARARGSGAYCSELRRHMKTLQIATWPLPIFHLLLQEVDADTVMQQASTVSQRGEAAFYIAQMKILSGEEDEAVRWLECAHTDCPPGFQERIGARAELSRIRAYADGQQCSQSQSPGVRGSEALRARSGKVESGLPSDRATRERL
jgi:lipoprotein NlpI